MIWTDLAASPGAPSARYGPGIASDAGGFYVLSGYSGQSGAFRKFAPPPSPATRDSGVRLESYPPPHPPPPVQTGAHRIRVGRVAEAREVRVAKYIAESPNMQLGKACQILSSGSMC